MGTADLCLGVPRHRPRGGRPGRCQETFLRAFRALPGFKGQAKFSSWLYRIALNLCRDWIRRKKRTPVVEMPEGVDIVELAAEQGPVESIEDLVARREMSRGRRRGMTLLPDEQRTAIILKEYHGLTFQEIADLQGCPLSTVKTRLVSGTDRAAAASGEAGHDAVTTSEKIMSEHVSRVTTKQTLVGVSLRRDRRADAPRGRRAPAPSARRAPPRVTALGDVRAELAPWTPPEARARLHDRVKKSTAAAVACAAAVALVDRPCRRGRRPPRRCWCSPPGAASPTCRCGQDADGLGGHAPAGCAPTPRPRRGDAGRHVGRQHGGRSRRARTALRDEITAQPARRSAGATRRSRSGDRGADAARAHADRRERAAAAAASWRCASRSSVATWTCSAAPT